MKRRQLMQSLVLTAAPCVIGMAQANNLFSRAIRIVLPYAPGGAADSLARAVAEGMVQDLGQPVVVDNKPGASGTTGSMAVSRADPDGHTLVMGTSASHSLNANVVHRWRQQARDAASSDALQPGGFIALPLAPQAPTPTACADVRIELRRGATTMTLSWSVSGAADLAA